MTKQKKINLFYFAMHNRVFLSKKIYIRKIPTQSNINIKLLLSIFFLFFKKNTKHLICIYNKMNLLENKKGIIIGVANEKSICWEIAKQCLENSATIVLSYTDATKSRVENLIEGKKAFCEKCDCSNDEDIKKFFEFSKKQLENIDFIVCAPAFANKEALKGKYYNISREDFLQSMNISVYSLTAIIKQFEPILNKNCSILTLSYYGAEKVIPNYNIMGVAKSALEISVKYLANDLGDKGIRVNSISSGAIKTLASSAIGDFKQVLSFGERFSPLKRLTTQDDVAKTAIFLLSDLSKGITAENIHVDCGLNSIGMFFDKENKNN